MAVLMCFEHVAMRVLMFRMSAMRMFRRRLTLMLFATGVFMRMLVGMAVLMFMAMDQVPMRMFMGVFVRVGMLVRC